MKARPIRPGRRVLRCWACRSDGPAEAPCCACEGRATYPVGLGLGERAVAALATAAAWLAFPVVVAWCVAVEGPRRGWWRR